MKKIYINGSYLSLSDQKNIFKDKYKIYNSFHIWEKKAIKGYFYWARYLLVNYVINLCSIQRIKADIQIFNSIIWCFFYSKKKKNIIIIHSYDIWINSDYIIENSPSKIMKYTVKILEVILWKYIRRQLQKFDGVLVATHDRLEYIRENINSESVFLPNIVEFENIYDSWKKKIIFCPERVDINKWLEDRKKVIKLFSQKLPHYLIIMIERWNDMSEFKSWLKKEKIDVQWVPYMTEIDLLKQISTSSYVIGIFNNWALSITNMQTMLLKTAIITYDKWEVIKIDKSEITEYTEKMIADDEFRKWEIHKNFTYISENHNLEKHREILLGFI